MSPTSCQLLYSAISGAGDRTRTGTALLPGDFKSPVSTNSTTPADNRQRLLYHIEADVSTLEIKNFLRFFAGYRRNVSAAGKIFSRAGQKLRAGQLRANVLFYAQDKKRARRAAPLK